MLPEMHDAMRRALTTLIAVTGVLAICTCQTRAQSANAAVTGGAREIARHGAWVVMAAADAASRICFATTQPKSSVPADARREPPYIYISAWPRDGVRAEVSVAGGVAYRSGSSVTLTIGQNNFVLFTAGDRAFVADPTTELKLIDAMRKGSSMLVKSVYDSGALVTDTYSLAGLTPTLAAINQACGAP